MALGLAGECLLELESGTKKQVDGGKLGREELWDAPKMGAGSRGQGGLPWHSAAALGLRLGSWVWGNREKRRSVDSLPGFLVGIAVFYKAKDMFYRARYGALGRGTSSTGPC